MKKFLYLAAVCLAVASCYRGPRRAERIKLYYINTFASNMMGSYYLWADEVRDQVKEWTLKELDPVGKVQALRYEKDKWTALYSDASTFMGSVNGDGKTYGFDPVADEKNARLIVPFVYAGSPAAKASLSRGDIFTAVNGVTLTSENCRTEIAKAFSGTTSVILSRADGSEVTLDAIAIYSDPVQLYKVLSVGGKKIGYLHYTNFTLRSGKDLERAFSYFKTQGIEELVIDLRYNGGGYSVIASALASMIAPMENVSAKDVFTKNIFNAQYTKNLEENGRVDQLQENFDTRFDITEQQGGIVQSGNVNPCVSRVWFITTHNTASASEALIAGLMPYMDVRLVGSATHGKSYSGSFLTGPDFYDAIQESGSMADWECDEGREYTENWGLYLIISRFADRNGNSPAVPDGIPVDRSGRDNPLDGHQLGDPEETLLHEALVGMGLASKADTKASIETGTYTFPLSRGEFNILLEK